MPRKPVPVSSTEPYHISARCLNREWFELPLDTVWTIMSDYLYIISGIHSVRVHAFVLMSNHFHLLATAPEANLGPALLYFMRETSKQITRLSGRINQTYGNRNHKTLIRGYHHFMNVYKYIYQNPTRAKICERVEEYPYSTLNGLLGNQRLVIPLVEDTILFTPQFSESALRWLNTLPAEGADEEMRYALRRPEFELKTCRKTGRLSALNEELY